MATADEPGSGTRDAAADAFLARHNEFQAAIRRRCEDHPLTLPLAGDARAPVERLLALLGCPMLLHLGDEGLYERIQRALEREEDPE